MLEKEILRKLLQKRRKNISDALRQRKNRSIYKKLFHDPFFRHATHVALYDGVWPEVETRPFLRGLLKTIKVYLPKVDPKKRTMVFRQVRYLTRDLKKGFCGIREPRAHCPRRSAGRMDVIIVPGVGFDRAGGRLGRGGGYYDRALRYAPKVPKIGLCFREQFVKKVPMEKQDVRVDKVITD